MCSFYPQTVETGNILAIQGLWRYRRYISNLRLFMLTVSWGRNASQTGYKTLKDIKQVGSLDT